CPLEPKYCPQQTEYCPLAGKYCPLEKSPKKPPAVCQLAALFLLSLACRLRCECIPERNVRVLNRTISNCTHSRIQCCDRLLNQVTVALLAKNIRLVFMVGHPAHFK